jgi:hypothetical protein
MNNNASFGYGQIRDGDANLQRLVQREKPLASFDYYASVATKTETD